MYNKLVRSSIKYAKREAYYRISVMIFKDRAHAGEELFKEICESRYIQKSGEDLVVVSLLRGGVILGDIISKKFKCPHLPLAVTKIGAPYNPELGIGAICFDIVYLEKQVIDTLAISKRDISAQIAQARNKFLISSAEYKITEKHFAKIKNKTVLLVDDGVATGVSARSACLFLKSKETKQVIFATPVGPSGFDSRGFDDYIVVHESSDFSAVSHFYQSFPQIEDEEVKRILRQSRNKTTQ